MNRQPYQTINPADLKPTCPKGICAGRRVRIPYTAEFVNCDCLADLLDREYAQRSGHKFPKRPRLALSIRKLTERIARLLQGKQN